IGCNFGRSGGRIVSCFIFSRILYHVVLDCVSFSNNFLPLVMGRVSSYHVRLNHQITSIYPFSR
ncbi:hypothetical protein KSS87_005411, partial [Heliosperma pusillum]